MPCDVMRHSFRRTVARTATGGAAAAIVGLSIGAPAAATTVVPDGAEQSVQVELHTLEPGAPAPGDRVEITGSITNITDEPLRDVQALLRYDSRPLTSRSDISRVTTDAGLHWGWRPGHIYDIVRDELAPGRSAPFELEFTVDTACLDDETANLPCLGLPMDGVYAIGVDANVTTPDDERHTGGTARTVVPWQIGDADPIPVALLWPVVGTPAIGDGALRDDAEPTTAPEDGADREQPDAGTDIVPDSRGQDPATARPALNRLLAAPGDAPVTWAVDPGTWSPTVAGAVRSTGELMVLPPGVPDAGALARVDRDLAGQVTAEVARIQNGFTPADVPVRMDAAWPGAGVVTEDALRAWTDAGYATLVLPRDAVTMPYRTPVAALELGGERVRAVLTDPGLDSAIADNAGPSRTGAQSAALDLRQRWLAETALARDEPLRFGTAALVAAPPPGWRPSPEVIEAVLSVWTSTDWIKPTGVSGLTDAAPPRREAVPAAVLSPLLAGTDGLPGDYARDIQRLHDELSWYHSLLGDDDAGDFAPVPARVAARAASIGWRDDLDTARAEVVALRHAVDEALSGVSVVVNPSNTLSGNTGVFPVNIANDLSHAVTVRLEFDPANRDRLAIEPVEARVPGGQQQTVQVRAEAVANGEVSVSVQLATVNGVPLGGAQHTIVNATHYGTIGWFVVGGSALLFAGGLSWRTLRGRRRIGP